MQAENYPVSGLVVMRMKENMADGGRPGRG